MRIPGSLSSRWQLDIPQSVFDVSFIKEQVRRLNFCGLPILHHHDYVSELPAGHRFGMKKFHGVMKYLKTDGIVSMRQVIQPKPVSLQTVKLVHSSAYAESFFSGSTSKEEQRRTGFTWTPGLLNRCRLETGGSILGSLTALERGLACSTGGGTHHAHSDFGSGYCLINDLAVASRYLLINEMVGKVLIVDLDVHQGDGTAAIFHEDSQVFTFSMHSEKNFPFRKQRSDLDLPLDDHVEDAEYLRELERVLPCLLQTVQPDIILYNAGVDPHVRDDLGRLSLTDLGLYQRDVYVIWESVSRGIPCFCVIGGGYSRDIQELSLRHTILHRAASRVWYEKHF